MRLLVHNPAVRRHGLRLVHLGVVHAAHLVHHNLGQNVLDGAGYHLFGFYIVHRQPRGYLGARRAAGTAVVLIADIHIDIAVDAVHLAVAGILPHLRLIAQEGQCARGKIRRILRIARHPEIVAHAHKGRGVVIVLRPVLAGIKAHRVAVFFQQDHAEAHNLGARVVIGMLEDPVPFKINVHRVIELDIIAPQRLHLRGIVEEIHLLPHFVQIERVAEQIRAHLDAVRLRVAHVGLKVRVDDVIVHAVAPRKRAYNGKLHAGGLYGPPIDHALIRGYVNAHIRARGLQLYCAGIHRNIAQRIAHLNLPGGYLRIDWEILRRLRRPRGAAVPAVSGLVQRRKRRRRGGNRHLRRAAVCGIQHIVDYRRRYIIALGREVAELAADLVQTVFQIRAVLIVEDLAVDRVPSVWIRRARGGVQMPQHAVDLYIAGERVALGGEVVLRAPDGLPARRGKLHAGGLVKIAAFAVQCLPALLQIARGVEVILLAVYLLQAGRQPAGCADIPGLPVGRMPARRARCNKVLRIGVSAGAFFKFAGRFHLLCHRINAARHRRAVDERFFARLVHQHGIGAKRDLAAQLPVGYAR